MLRGFSKTAGFVAKGFLATLISGALATTSAFAQNTAPDLAGTWKTDSLTQNRIGYELTLKSADSDMNAYQGILKFRHRDGRKTKPVKIGLSVGKSSQGSVRVTIVMPKGSLATGEGTVSGKLSTTDGSMYFPTCSKIWPLAMKGEEDTDCLFRELPN